MVQQLLPKWHPWWRVCLGMQERQGQGFSPRVGKIPGAGNGSPLQCPCLENPRAEEPGGLQPMGSQRLSTHTCHSATAGPRGLALSHGKKSTDWRAGPGRDGGAEGPSAQTEGQEQHHSYLTLMAQAGIPCWLQFYLPYWKHDPVMSGTSSFSFSS